MKQYQPLVKICSRYRREGAAEQADMVLVRGKPQAWLMALFKRTSPGVPGKTRKCKAS